MYQQYRKTNGNICELIDISGRFDEENQKIIAHYTNAKMTYNDILKTYIFPNWEDGDILFINNFSIVKPIFDSDKNIIREMTREEVCESGDLSVLDIGEVHQEGAIIKKEKPNGVKIEWIYPNWIETASDDEITEYIGKNITKLLYEVLSIGCEVTVSGEKHQQSLSDEKRKALNERISGFKLAEELGSPITHVAWPFKNDGTDTVVMTTDKFKQLALTCLDFGDKCYIAAELLKAKRNINTTLEDFYSELEYIDEINLENL